jgi:hypothetical protein
MKKLLYFTALVFIVSLISYSCKKEENPVTTNTGGNPITTSWTSQYKGGLNIPIVSNGITEDILNVTIPSSDYPTNYIKNVNLVLDSIIGVDASQLKFDLIHQGDTIRVIDTLNNGGPGNSFIHTVLSDSTTDPIRTASSPFTGIFRPAHPFSVFRDFPPEGQYRLRISNSGSFKSGVIKSWGITVSYSPMMSNYCLEFNGINQCDTVSNSPSINSILTNKTFTLEGWYYITGYTSYYFSFLDKLNSWYCEYSRSDSTWTLVDPGVNTVKSNKLPVQLNTWYHIAVTFNGANNTANFYSNGTLIGTRTTTLTFNTQNSNPLYIANGKSGTSEFGKGRYDEIRIWNVVRTQTEISSNYNKSLTGGESGLVLYLKFNDGSGTITRDATANANNGYLVNNPIWSTDGPNITR